MKGGLPKCGSTWAVESSLAPTAVNNGIGAFDVGTIMGG